MFIVMGVLQTVVEARRPPSGRPCKIKVCGEATAHCPPGGGRTCLGSYYKHCPPGGGRSINFRWNSAQSTSEISDTFR